MVDLGKEHPVEEGVTVIRRIGQIDVGDLAAALALHVFLVARHPVPLTQSDLAPGGYHSDGSRRARAALPAHCERHLFVDRILEEGENVHRGVERVAVDRQNVIAFRDVDAGCRQR